MNRDEVIRMAREAGIIHPEMVDKTLERFAAFVAAAEREKAAAWMVARSYATGHGDTTEDLLKELEWQVRESEREACAGLCGWKTGVRPVDAAIETCAAAIRARGETK